MQNKSSMGDTARSDSQSVICLPILKVNMQILVPTAARGIARLPVCGPVSVSTGQNYFRKLSSGVNIFLTFSLPSCYECECCMSSLKLPEGIMSVAACFTLLFCVCSVWFHQAKCREKEWVRKAKEYQQKEKAVYWANKKPNKICPGTISLPTVLLMFQHTQGWYRDCWRLKRSLLAILSLASFG